ncbi:hypothetical protein SH601_06805 [Gracilibacillus sp. S3-1-1]|uniref:Uncharacterized protein n=1 Tax=Gracilibacillus pellucidus TaxID=3095368 RepID=A0ACC6M403_9BACI|nr:YheC/YheD family protein [Gracilibacillus sp. S3-1-1]MDX8045696.1 hypothetical protein [Gracilibacillus sp. S3-1-1]
MYQLFQVKSYPNNKQRLIIPSTTYANMKHISALRHGLQSLSCDILTHHRHTNIMYVSSAIMRKCSLKNNTIILLTIDQHTCHIHYPLGVFIHDAPNKIAHARLLQEMARVGHSMGFESIFFSYQHIEKDSASLTGFVWDEHNWHTIKTEIPPVIYNRIPNRKMEANQYVANTKNQLAAHSIIFNPHFFNKWQLYDKLINQETISYLLPDTIFHPSIQMIEQKLEEHPVYVESLQQDTTFHLAKRGDTIVVTNKKGEQFYYPTVARLALIHFPNGFHQYVLQDDINTNTYHGEPYYMKVHLNKIKDWHVSFLYGKQRTNGDIIDADHLPKISKTKSLAISISNDLEKILPGPIGELGLDIGIDQEQKLWLLEFHAKPTWKILSHPSFSSHTHQYFTSLFQFSFVTQLDFV